MKRTIILTLAILMVFSIPLTALATEGEANVSGEVSQETNVKVHNPDSFIYTIQRLYEEFRLMTTFNEENKLNMHIELAGKRLQELGGLDGELKNEFSAELYSDFLANIEKAIILTVQLKEQQKEMDVTLEQFEQVILEGETIIAQLENEIELKLSEKEQETKEFAKVAPAVVAHIDADIISEMRAEGFGYGQIAILVSISEQSETELEEVKKLAAEHKGMGKVAKELGLHPGNLIKIGKQKAEPVEGNEEETTSIETTNETALEVESEAKLTTETKGNGKAHGLKKKEEQKIKGKGNAAIKLETNLGIGIGLGNSKKDNE